MINLYKGDCLEVMDSLIDKGVKVDAIITDPPYLYLKHKLDRQFNEVEFFKKCYSLIDNGYIVFFGRGASLAKWITICAELGFEFKEELVWDKKQVSSPMMNLMRCHELAIVMKKGNIALNKVYIDKIEYDTNNNDIFTIADTLRRLCIKFNAIKTFEDFQEWIKGDYIGLNKGKTYITTSKDTKTHDKDFSRLKGLTKGKVLSSILRVNRENYTAKHPTQKPLQLMEHITRLVSNESQLVLDPFMGSGSTGAACFNLKRDFIGIELDDEYFSIAKDRIKDMVNNKSLFDDDIQLIINE